MPPLPLSEDESSDAESERIVKPSKTSSHKKAVEKKPETDPMFVADDESEKAESEKAESEKAASDMDEKQEEQDAEVDDEDDKQLGEEEYIVESIKGHMVNEKGVLVYHVKWEGWDNPADMTWEPEDNLRGTADLILDKYIKKSGGLDKMMKESNDGASKQRGRKRGRASTVTETPKNGKRSRTSPHPASTSPPASLSERKFQPPTGSWEDAVQNIDACEDHEGNIFVFLTWEGGHKTQHPLEQVYKRCPYKMLKFYESHLSFHHRPPSAQNSG